MVCVINSPCNFTYYLDVSNFILESGLSYFRVLTICLLLVYSVSAAGCHCFGLYTFHLKISFKPFFLFVTVTSAVALAALVAPDSLSHYLEIIKAWELPAWFLFSGKCVLVFPVMYHTFNGIRHLVRQTVFFCIGIMKNTVIM